MQKRYGNLPVAFKVYKRAVKKGVTDEEIKPGIEAYKQQIKVQHTEKSFVAHGSTWFNQERWADEYDVQPHGMSGYMYTDESNRL